MGDGQREQGAERAVHRSASLLTRSTRLLSVGGRGHSGRLKLGGRSCFFTGSQGDLWLVDRDLEPGAVALRPDRPNTLRQEAPRPSGQSQARMCGKKSSLLAEEAVFPRQEAGFGEAVSLAQGDPVTA